MEQRRENNLVQRDNSPECCHLAWFPRGAYSSVKDTNEPALPEEINEIITEKE